MAGDLRGLALEKAHLLSGRLRELLSAGQDYARERFGVDLGLEPERYPTWAVLSSAAAGLLLLLTLSWAAVCGGALAGKRRQQQRRGGSPVSAPGEPPAVKAEATARTAKGEEPKKRSRKKASEKAAAAAAAVSCQMTKSQSNGQPVTVAQEDHKTPEVVSKLPAHIKPEKVREVQAPVQVKKNKKKNKSDVKPAQHVSTSDAKETDEGAWETKVSNREKRQQRRKDKGPEDSGSSGGLDAPKAHVTPTAAPANTKKRRGNEASSRTKVDAAGGDAKASSNRREEPSVNGGWTDVSPNLPGQMSGGDRAKWRSMAAAPQYSGPAETQCWTQETQAWTGIDGGAKSDLNPVSYTMQRIKTSDQMSNSIQLQWTNALDVDDEWSAHNGPAAADPSSDWNAPAEHWGNYEEPALVLIPTPAPKEHNKVLISEDEKDPKDPSGAAAKSKRRRKKKKTEEEAASEAQVVVSAVSQAKELPVTASKKQNPSISSSQRMPDQAAEPPKASQKKKSRRET